MSVVLQSLRTSGHFTPTSFGGRYSEKGSIYLAGCPSYFFAFPKGECAGKRVYCSHEQARQAIFEYLEIYYNRQKRHSTLGYVSPLVYEQLGMQTFKSNA